MQMEDKRVLPTIWRVPDELWEKIEPVIAEHDPPKHTGRRRIGARAALDAIIYRLRTGCQWNQLPKEFPDDSSVHRTFSRKIGTERLVGQDLGSHSGRLPGTWPGRLAVASG